MLQAVCCTAFQQIEHWKQSRFVDNDKTHCRFRNKVSLIIYLEFQNFRSKNNYFMLNFIVRPFAESSCKFQRFSTWTSFSCVEESIFLVYQTLPHFFRAFNYANLRFALKRCCSSPFSKWNNKPFPWTSRGCSLIRQAYGYATFGNEYDLQERFERPREAVRRFRDTVDAKRQSLSLIEMTTSSIDTTELGNRFFRLLEGTGNHCLKILNLNNRDIETRLQKWVKPFWGR